jgi:pyruvate formate lyase activating enzyme
MDTLLDEASPDALAAAAQAHGCRSVAFTYNDPVIFHEYAIDVAAACHARGIRTVAVTAGYQCAEPRAEFYRYMDAANVDLKAFTDDFYRKVAAGRLGPVLETLLYLRWETDVWFEITNLLIPGLNDGDAELTEMTQWVVENLGAEVPMHFTAFHPDYRMLDRPRTPRETLLRARRIAREQGVRYAYIGNVADNDAGATFCYGCGQKLIGRMGYTLTTWALDEVGRCTNCQTALPGVLESVPGQWGSRRERIWVGA